MSAVLENGRWKVGGCDLRAVAQRFGTPLYLLDRATIQAACRAYLDGLSAYPGPVEVTFASKSLPAVAIDRLIFDAGLGIEASSGGEVQVALSAGVPGERISFNGNNKSEEELRFALENRVGRFIVDGFGELHALDELARATGIHPKVTLRLTPGIEAHTHEFIRTGQVDSKFGFGEPELDEAFRFLADSVLDYQGVQAHIGSQIFETEPFRVLVSFLFDCAEKARAFGLETSELNLGGGLGIAYSEEDSPPAIFDFARMLASFVEEESRERHQPYPRLVLEPGRSIVGTAGFTLYTAGHEKIVPGVRRYVMVDGGMPDNPRPITYGSSYLADLVEPREIPTEKVTIAGKCCESGDILIDDARIDPRPGDLLIVWTTGAYCFAMSSNYNRLPRPAMVLLGDGNAQLIRERERYLDLIKGESIPCEPCEVRG